MKKLALAVMLSLAPSSMDDPEIFPRYQDEQKHDPLLKLAKAEKPLPYDLKPLPLTKPLPVFEQLQPYQPSLPKRKETLLEKREEQRIWNEMILPAWEKSLYFLEQDQQEKP